MVKRITVATAMLIGANCYAQNELVFNGGIGKQNSAVKFMHLSLITTPIKALPYFKLAPGAAFLSMSELTVYPTYCFTLEPMIEAKTSLGLYLRVSHGIGYISQHNRYLNNNLQLFTRISGGLSTDKINLGVFYRHISSGKNEANNQGINLIGIEFGVNL